MVKEGAEMSVIISLLIAFIGGGIMGYLIAALMFVSKRGGDES